MMLLFQVPGAVSCCEDVERFGPWTCLQCCREASSARSNCCCFGGIPSLKLHATSLRFLFSFHQLNCLNLHPFFSGPVSISFWSVDSSRSSRWIPLLLLIYFLFIIIIMFFGVFKICLLLCNDEGLVRSPVTATLPQIGSRLYLTWVILYSVPEVGIILPSKLPILM